MKPARFVVETGPDPKKTPVFAHFSQNSAFLQNRDWLLLLTHGLKKQGFSRIIFSGVTSREDLPAIDRTHQEEFDAGLPVLVLKDSFAMSMNLPLLLRNLKGQSLVYAGLPVRLPESPEPLKIPWDGQEVWEKNSDHLPEDLGAFACTAGVFFNWLKNQSQKGQQAPAPEPARAMILDAGPVHSLEETRSWLSRERRGCLFLDRDGILNEDCHYPHRAEQLSLLTGIIPAIRWARDHNWRVIVLTNQSGIGRGKFTQADLHEFNRLINQQLSGYDAGVDEFFFCPFHPQADLAEYRKKSPDRKPLPGMALKAMSLFPTDLTRSCMAGDKASDQILLPGISRVLIRGEYPLKGCKAPVLEELSGLTTFLEKTFPAST